ncbi:MAG: DUF59 domain-containing protein [Planctomycetes bacterium]|nr:DUF59 domain-containing protein [Planctomycetota bacterium]
MSKNKDEQLRKDIVRALRTVHDPEIPVNIYDLGLVYNIEFDDAGSVQILMTLTSPACPVAGMLVTQVENKVKTVEAVSDAHVELVWDPPWTVDRMSEAARLELNLEPGEAPRIGGPQFFDITTPGK